jgi:hypothetical protein
MMRSSKSSPGDPAAGTTVEGWLQDCATSRDPQLRERIILADLGQADQLASRHRHSPGLALVMHATSRRTRRR